MGRVHLAWIWLLAGCSVDVTVAVRDAAPEPVNSTPDPILDAGPAGSDASECECAGPMPVVPASCSMGSVQCAEFEDTCEWGLLNCPTATECEESSCSPQGGCTELPGAAFATSGRCVMASDVCVIELVDCDSDDEANEGNQPEPSG